MKNLLKNIVSRKFKIPVLTTKKENEPIVIMNDNKELEKLKGKVVFLSAGHRGDGTGANGFIDEGKETIAFRDKLRIALIQRGIIVDGDFGKEKESLSSIMNYIKTKCKFGDISIDIHFNAVSDSKVSGTEVIIPTKYVKLEQDFAATMSNTMSTTLKIKNRGVKTEVQTAHGTLGMLSGFNCLNFLIEICFVSNKTDSTNYNLYNEQLIENLADDIKNFILNN